MAITGGMTNNYMLGLGKKLYNHTVTTGDVFKLMLLDADATRDMDDTVYSATGEVTGTGYSAKGVVIASVTPVLAGSSGSGLRKVLFDWADAVFTTVTLTNVGGAQIINTTVSDASVLNLAFTAVAVTAGDLTIIMPAAASTTAILRF